MTDHNHLKSTRMVLTKMPFFLLSMSLSYFLPICLSKRPISGAGPIELFSICTLLTNTRFPDQKSCYHEYRQYDNASKGFPIWVLEHHFCSDFTKKNSRMTASLRILELFFLFRVYCTLNLSIQCMAELPVDRGPLPTIVAYLYLGEEANLLWQMTRFSFSLSIISFLFLLLCLYIFCAFR